jgi:DNA-binding beta-propeller fold protein YncE
MNAYGLALLVLLVSISLEACTRQSSTATTLPPAATECNAPSRDASVTVSTPGNPFQALPSVDGCWVFVSIVRGANDNAAIALYRRSQGSLRHVRDLHIAGSPTGMALTSDGKLLVVADNDRVAFIDTDRLIAGESGAILGYLVDTTAKGRVYASVTPDDKFAFIADENSATVSVIDIAKARASRFDISATVGKIPTGAAPIAMVFTADRRHVFITSQRAPASYAWRIECKREANNPANDLTPVSPEGAIHVVDLARAVTDPAHSIVSNTPAGCSPVRLVLSPDGTRAYVTARNSNALLAFDASTLTSGSPAEPIGRVPVGSSPVGVAVVDQGRQIVVTNSNRFAGGAGDRQSLTVIDAARAMQGAGAIVGAIPAGTFPRELRVTPDGRTLILTNFGSRTVQMIDLARAASVR